MVAAPVAVCLSTVYVALPADACEITLYGNEVDGGSYDYDATIATFAITGGNNLIPGNYTVTMTYTTRNGSATCWSTVVVQDKTAPTVTCTDRTYYLVAPDQPFVINTDYLVSVTDNCQPIPVINLNVFDSNTFGTTPFSASATDNGGNTGSCSGTVTTVDAEPQNYCSSSRNPYYEHISNISLGAINHSSGADGGYNWNYPEGSNTLYHGSTYTMSYTPGFAFSSTYHEYWSVYIDKNGDGDFTDSGELLHQWNGYGGNSFSFTSPGTYWGWSRIRVVMRYGGYATSPCGGGGYGETEDISVYLRPFFWFPWPGFRQAEDLAEMTGNSNQAMSLGSTRPVEAAIPEEAEQRRQLSSPTSPGTNSGQPTAVPVKVFPNPARAGQAINIFGQNQGHDLLLRNMTGQVVKTYPGTTTRAFLPGNLPAGIYLLSGIASEGGQAWTRRVMVR